MTDSHSPVHGNPERRAQLLAAARECFLDRGYKGTPISAIVRSAGVAQGTFYLYFSSKQAVLAALRRELFRDYLEVIEGAVGRPGTPEERVVGLIADIADVVHRNLDLERVCRASESAEATELAALEGRERLAASLIGALQEGRTRGTFDVARPELAAQFVVTLFDNVLYEALAYGRPASAPEVVREGTAFTLRALGVHAERVDQLLADVPTWSPR